LHDHSSGSHDLDEVGAVLDVLAALLHCLVEAICHAIIRESELRREIVSAE
jgi:hypothetical protein